MNFKDLDGDGIPSTEELEASDDSDWEGTIEYGKGNGEWFTEEEAKAEIENIESTYKFTGLYGEYSYEELLSQLK